MQPLHEESESALLDEPATGSTAWKNSLRENEGPSPFLPDTSIRFAWDSTTIGALKRCPRYYQLMYLEGWRPKGESIDLRFGSEFHMAKQDYAKERAEGYNHDEAVFDVIRELMIRTDDWRPTEETHGKKAKYKNRESLIRRVIWDLDDFKDDPAQTYILANGKPAVELSFAFELPYGPTNSESPYLLCGHLDRIVRYNDELFTEDYKTTTRTVGSYFFDQFHPDNQMTLYTIAGQTILKAPIRGVLINGVQLGIEVETNRTVRSFTYRTEGQLQEWLADLRSWLDNAETYALTGHWPMNDTACDKYGGCPFRGICSKDPEIRQSFLASNFEKAPLWNPLKPR